MADVRIVWDRKAVRELRTDPAVTAETRRAAEGLGRLMQARAPRDSGGGAGSIDPRKSRAKGAFDVGWDAAHYYMIFPEFGTEHQDAQRFARGALNEYQLG